MLENSDTCVCRKKEGKRWGQSPGLTSHQPEEKCAKIEIRNGSLVSILTSHQPEEKMPRKKNQKQVTCSRAPALVGVRMKNWLDRRIEERLQRWVECISRRGKTDCQHGWLTSHQVNWHHNRLKLTSQQVYWHYSGGKENWRRMNKVPFWVKLPFQGGLLGDWKDRSMRSYVDLKVLYNVCFPPLLSRFIPLFHDTINHQGQGQFCFTAAFLCHL